MKRVRILLVDDHKLIRVGLRQILEAEGSYEIVGEAENGEQALELARELHPDIVVMDINMPQMNGIEATRRMLRISPAPKVLIVTMHSAEPMPSKLLEAGASGYLSKDNAAEEILGALNELRRGKRYLSAELARRMALSGLDGESPLKEVSDREMDVLLRVVDGQSLQEIADALSVSPKTVATYRYRLYGKLGVRNDVELTRLAVRYQLVEESINR